MNAAFFQKLEAILHSERMDAYRQDKASAERTLARYALNMALCEALYPALQYAEIALRNAIHRGLTIRCGTDQWYDAGLGLTPWQEARIQDAKTNLARNAKPNTSGRIVAELTFGFWTAFFNHFHARSGIGHFLTRHVFAHAPKTERALSKVDTRWNAIRDLRNRVFHHERIIHWRDLHDQHDSILQVIGWISPELRQMTEAMDRFKALRAEGLGPWLDKIEHQWPAPPTS